MTNIADFKNIDTELDKIRIMIVEDHPLFGQGLRRVLEGEDDLRVIAEVEDGIEAVDAAIEADPVAATETLKPVQTEAAVIAAHLPAKPGADK